jgi:membrane protein
VTVIAPAGRRVPGLAGLAGEVWRKFKRDNVPAYAGHLTYLGLLALVPFFVFLISMVGVLASRADLVQEFIRRASATLPQEALALLDGPILEAALERNTAFTAGAVASIAVSLFAMSGAMRGMMQAMNVMHDATETRGLVRRYLMSGVLSLVVVFLLVGALVLALAGDAISRAVVREGMIGRAFEDVWQVVQWPLMAAVGLLAFLLIYRLAPAQPRGLRALAPGGGLALVLWLAFSAAFSVYVSAVARYDALYGALAGVIVLMLYMFHSALALLVGAELNQVLWSRRRGPGGQVLSPVSPRD